MRGHINLVIFLKEIVKNKLLYIMTIPGLLLLFLFSYLPMLGTIIAFKEFRFDKGVFGSAWTNPIYRNFIFFFTNENAFRITRNTVLLNLSFIIMGGIFEVFLAIMLAETSNKFFKKLAQSISFLPYFVSWIVVGVFTINIFSYETGSLNNFISIFGFQRVNWNAEAGYWPIIMFLIFIWKMAGYYAVYYLATIASIDSTYYEAAQLDGATKVQQIRFVTIPMLMPAVITLTLLQVGRIMNADFGMFYSVVGENAQIYSSVDVIDTFIFRTLRQVGDFGMASAAGFFQSCLAFIIVIASNKIARKYDKDAAIY
jgi:putative aldouronate transport system permease protein